MDSSRFEICVGKLLRCEELRTINVTVELDRTSNAPNILPTVQFWVRFIDFDPEYQIPTSDLYYSNESFRRELKVVYSDDDELIF